MLRFCDSWKKITLVLERNAKDRLPSNVADPQPRARGTPGTAGGSQQRRGRQAAGWYSEELALLTAQELSRGDSIAAYYDI